MPRVVVPLIPLGTQFMAAIPTSELKHEIGNLADRRDEIVNAIDLLLQGS
jgi:CcdB protein